MKVAPAPQRLARLARLRALMRTTGLDALLVTSLPNVAYLTGLFASAAAVIVTRDGASLITDGRYLGIAQKLFADADGVELSIAPANRPFDVSFAEGLCKIGKGRAGFEAAHLSVKRHADLSSRLSALAPDSQLEATEGLVEG